MQAYLQGRELQRRGKAGRFWWNLVGTERDFADLTEAAAWIRDQPAPASGWTRRGRHCARRNPGRGRAAERVPRSGSTATTSTSSPLAVSGR